MSDDYRIEKKWQDLQRRHERARKEQQRNGIPIRPQQPNQQDRGYQAPDRRRAS